MRETAWVTRPSGTIKNARPARRLPAFPYSASVAIRTIVWFSPCDAISMSAFLPEPVTKRVWALSLVAVTT